MVVGMVRLVVVMSVVLMVTFVVKLVGAQLMTVDNTHVHTLVHTQPYVWTCTRGCTDLCGVILPPHRRLDTESVLVSILVEV